MSLRERLLWRASAPGVASGLGCLVLAATGCATGDSPRAPQPTTATSSPAPSVPVYGPVRIAVTIERRVQDAATEGFPAAVRATLTDPRGWPGAGFEFVFSDDAPYRVVLAEGPEVDRLCRPYDTGGRYSCQNGPIVALNAERWRVATPQWTGDLDTYRQMLVNHEVGHLLGQHHPSRQCPQPGESAPLMAQQSTELDGCLPNPWPLPGELACAARHLEPLAPAYEDHPTSRCGPEASGTGGR